MKETANISLRSVYSLSMLSWKDIKTIERALKGLITTFVGRFERYRKVIGRYQHARKIARESSAVDLLFMSHRLEPGRLFLSFCAKLHPDVTRPQRTCHFAR